MANQTQVIKRSWFLADVFASIINGCRNIFGTLTDGGHTHPGTASQLNGFVRYEAPIAAELISIVAALDPVANGELTIAAQPDYPRKLQVALVDANSSISAGIVTLVGVGVHGQAVTQAISLTGGSATTTTTHAYATITSATVSGLVGAASGDTISIGVATALGLPGPYALTPSAFTVYKANLDNADSVIGTVDATNATIVPNSVPNGSRNYSFWYRYTYTPAIAASATTGITTAVGGSSKFHKSGSEKLVTLDDATDTASAIPLVNEIVAVYQATNNKTYPGHVADEVAHLVADATNLVTEPKATNLATAMDRINDYKAQFNAHLSQSGVHINNDGSNSIAAADATDEGSLVTLVNQAKSKTNTHIQNAVPGSGVRVIDA